MGRLKGVNTHPGCQSVRCPASRNLRIPTPVLNSLILENTQLFSFPLCFYVILLGNLTQLPAIQLMIQISYWAGIFDRGQAQNWFYTDQSMMGDCLILVNCCEYEKKACKIWWAWSCAQYIQRQNYHLLHWHKSKFYFSLTTANLKIKSSSCTKLEEEGLILLLLAKQRKIHTVCLK